MLAKYFVPVQIAIALKGIGFDEPCISVWERAANGKRFTDNLYILTDESYARNCMLTAASYAAPLYDQVFEWFIVNGLSIHDYYIPGPYTGKGKETEPGNWSCSILTIKTGKSMWPGALLATKMKPSLMHKDRRGALDQAILEAIKIIKNNEVYLGM